MFRLLEVISFVAILVALPHAQGQTSAPSSPAKSATRTSTKPATIVNLNTAGATELAGLPGVGAKTAARIVEYRQKNGPFKKVEELMNVQGIGEKSFLKLKSQITVAAKPETAATQQN